MVDGCSLGGEEETGGGGGGGELCGWMLRPSGMNSGADDM